MKTLLSIPFLMVATLCATAKANAQNVRYALTGTYSDTTPTTALTAPGGAFTFEFLVPASVANFTPSNQPLSIDAPVLSGSYTFGGSTGLVSSGTYHFSESAGNETDLTLHASFGDIYFWARNTLNDHLTSLAGRPDDADQSHFFTGNLGTKGVDAISFQRTGGDLFTVSNVTGKVVGTTDPVAEPSSMGMIAVGLAACGGVAFIRHWRSCLIP